MGLFGFITAPFAAVGTAIGKVVSAGKTKAAAKINADNAAKQRAHELHMADLARQSQAVEIESKRKNQMLLLAGGGILIAFFIFRKKR